MADYRIELGIGLKDGDFESIQGKIKSLEKDAIKIKLDDNTIDAQIKNIETRLRNLDGIKIDLGNSIGFDSNTAIKSAQQVGQNIGKNITKEVKKNLNFDGVIEKETVALMREYNISTKSKSGKIAKDEIKKALTGYVNEVRSGGKNIDSDIFGSINTIDVALNKVRDTIAKNKKEVKELDILYEDMLRDIKSVNNSKGSTKISLPDMRSEWRDDYENNKKLLGSWFSEKYVDTVGSIGIDSWIKTKNWSTLFDLDTSHQNIASQLIEKIKEATTVYSGDELFKEGFLKIGDVEARIKESASNIIATEQQVVQSSDVATDAITQNYQKQQEAIKANLEAKKAEIEQEKKRLTEINKSVEDYKSRFLEASTTEDPKAMEYWAKMQSLEDESESLKAHIDSLDAAYNKEVQQAQEAANKVTQAEKEKRQAYQEIAKTISSIQKGDFQKSFAPADDDLGGMKNTAKSVEQYFKNLQGVISDTVSVQERFDSDGNLDGFTVSLKNANGEAEKLRYTFKAAEKDSSAFFKYTGGSIDDKTVGKQIEKSVKKANDLQIKLDKIQSGYLNSTKPIKDNNHVKSLGDQYDKVKAAIDAVRNADDATYQSMVSNVETEIATLENLVAKYRNIETVATSLRSKDFDTVKATYADKLDEKISKIQGAGVYKSDYGEVDGEIVTFEKRAEQLKAMLSSVAKYDRDGLVQFLNELDKLESGYKKTKAAKDELNKSQNVGSSVSGLKSELEILQQASPSIKSFKTEINGAEVSIESLLKDLDQVGTKGDFKVVEGKVEAFGKAAEAAGIDLNEAKNEAKKANDAYKQMLDIQKQIRSLSIKEKNLTELSNTNELNEVSAKLKDLKADYESLKRTFGSKLTDAQFGTLQAEVDATESELKQLDAKWADTKVKLAKSIKADIELGNVENEMDSMRVKFNSLSDANDKLRNSFEATENAYKVMMSAAKANTGDEVADREQLIQAEKKYAAALEKTNNLIKQQARADSMAEAAEKLADKKTALQLDMASYLKENSRAANEFGDEIKRLSSLLDNVSLDDAGVNKISRTFKNLTKEIKNAGKDGLTVFDKLKSKAKEYMTYLSAAEVFMWIEQGMREMFNTVLEIDTAMTGLYRVTDLTASQYDTLFDNMISSAKEYGATLNDIINATSDWVRAGFDADTALGLAEVTTMYQHISDLDYDTAAENLITAYNGFKNELNGLFGGDEVAAVNYIADVLNELDNNYAATSAGIGEALTRSASALDLAGNSIQETAG